MERRCRSLSEHRYVQTFGVRVEWYEGFFTGNRRKRYKQDFQYLCLKCGDQLKLADHANSIR